MKNLIPELVILLGSFSFLIIGVFAKNLNKIINYFIPVLLGILILFIYFNFLHLLLYSGIVTVSIPYQIL